MKSSTSQDRVWLASCALMTLAFIVCQVFSTLSTVGEGVIFRGPTWEANITVVEINPAGWTFSIWGVIYIFQALWIIHALVSICRTSANGGPLYKNPEIVSRFFLLVFAINMCLNVTWLILWDRALVEAALAVLILLILTLYVILVDYYRRITRNVQVMAEEHKVDLILHRIFLQNGVSIYATWVTIATLLNLAILLAERTDLSQQTVCLIALSILALELVIFVVLDWFVFERYLRYTFSTYITTIWALFGITMANWDPAKPHAVMTVVLLALACVLFVGKIVLTIVNAKRKPLYEKASTPLEGVESVALST